MTEPDTQWLSTPIEFSVLCRTSRDRSQPGRKHTVTVGTDATFTVPHDLAAERIMAGFGGYLTCLELVDLIQPALQEWCRLQHRLVSPVVRSHDGREWAPQETLPGCCKVFGVYSPRDAARHARSADHVARKHSVQPRSLSRLVERVAPAVQPPDVEPERELWDCGVHPDHAAEVRRLLGDDEATAELILAANASSVDPGWLSRVLPRSGAATGADLWLAWNHWELSGLDDAEVRGWLAVGVRPRLLPRLIGAGYSTDDVLAIAGHWGRSADGTAAVLQRWIDADLRPGVADLTGVHTAHWPTLAVPPSAVSRLRLRRALGPSAPSELLLALALVTHGDISHAVRALRAG